jgi:predicted PurR-regulated permease PerM
MPDGPHPGTPTQRALKWTIFLGATIVILYFCLRILEPFRSVLAWSSVLATLFYPLHQRLVRRTGHVSLSAFISSAMVAVAFIIPLLVVSALAVNQLIALRESLERAVAEGSLADGEPQRRAYAWIAPRLGLEPATLADWVREHTDELAGAAAEYTLTFAASVTRAIVSFVFVIFALFLLFRDGHRIAAKIPDLLPFERQRSEALLLRIREVIYGGVYGVVVIALLQGLVCGVMFWLLGVPSPALWGMATVMMAVLPMLGAASVWVPGTAYLVAAGHWPKAILMALVGLFIISSVDNFLRPRLVGGRVGLNELAMFVAMLGGLRVFGVLGIVLGPVLFAIAISIFHVLNERPPDTPAAA